MDGVSGAPASGTGSHAPHEAPDGSSPIGFDPSRIDPEKAYLLGSLDERKAVSRYLIVRAARAAYHATQLPWWAFIRRSKAIWSAAGHAIAAKEIEVAAHVEDQAVWLVEIGDGVIIAREAFKRDRDASLAEDAERLSPEGVAARAVEDGIAQTPAKSLNSGASS